MSRCDRSKKRIRSSYSLSPADLKMLREIRKHYGCKSDAEAVRMAIRKHAVKIRHVTPYITAFEGYMG